MGSGPESKGMMLVLVEIAFGDAASVCMCLAERLCQVDQTEWRPLSRTADVLVLACPAQTSARAAGTSGIASVKSGLLRPGGSE